MILIAAALAASHWTMLLAGDVMLNGIRPSRQIWSGISEEVKAADVAFANLEIPWTTAKHPTTTKGADELKAKTQFVLKADPGNAQYFAGAGWDLVTLANNHAMDFRAAGLRETITLLNQQRIGHSGAGATKSGAMKPAHFALADGTRVALISAMAFVGTRALGKTTPATKDSAGVHALDLGGQVDDRAKTRIRTWIMDARKGSDLVVVAMHWGVEKQSLPIPYQVSLGRALVDCGADVVWGHHPHVLQGAEMYRGKPILYSTGNLISPLGGPTALFRMHFTGRRCESIRLVPCRIAAGKVSLANGKDRDAIAANFRKLCAALKKRYPSPHAKLPALD